MLNLQNINELNLSHCSAIIVSEEIANEGFDLFLSTICNNIEIRPTCNILVSKESAKDLLEQSSKAEDISSKYYNSFINSARNTSYVTPCQLSEFYSASTGKDVKQPVAVYSFIANDTLESLGLIAFKGTKMVGRLSGVDTMCYNILTNNFDRATIEIYNRQMPEYPITVSIARSDSTKIKEKLENGKLVATCKVSVEAKLLSANQVLDLSNKQIRKNIRSWNQLILRTTHARPFISNLKRI